jgi:superfamily II DNA or RNA helicase
MQKHLRKWQSSGLAKLAPITPRYNNPRRGLVFAPPGAGKSFFAALLTQQSLNYPGTVVIAYSFSYLEAEFISALAEVGITDVSVYAASSDRAFDPACRVQLVSLQTLDARGLDEFAHMTVNTLIVDEAHTALNYKAAVAGITKLRVGRVVGLTGTYFDGTLLTDEARNHGEWLSRCEPELLITAGTHEDMVAQGILRPIQYFRLKQVEVDHYAPATVADTVALWKRHNPAMDRSWFFVSKADKKRSPTDPIELYRDALIAGGVEPICLSGKSTDAEIAEARNNPDRVLVSCDWGAVGYNNPRCHTTVLAKPSSPNKLGQMIGRANRATTGEEGLLTTVIDAACNFATDGQRGHLILEDAIRELVENPQRLFTHAVNGVKVEQPTVVERGVRKKAPSCGEYGVTLSEDALRTLVRSGVPGVKHLKQLLIEDGNQAVDTTLGMLLHQHGLNFEALKAYL